VAIARRSTAGTVGGSPGTSGVFTSPAGGVADDIVIFRVSGVNSGGEAAPTITPPDGTWTEDTNAWANQTNATPDHTIKSFWKRLTGNIAATYTFTFSVSSYYQAIGVCYSGCVTSGSPIDSSGATVAVTDSLDATANAITTVLDNTMLIFWGSSFNYAYQGALPSGMSSAVTSSNLYTAQEARPTAGTTGSKVSVGAVPSGDKTTGALEALAPPSAGGIPPGLGPTTQIGQVNMPLIGWY
jgi:hypothetical protein